MRREEKSVSDVELSKKLDRILQRLDLLEKLIVENLKFKGVAASLGTARFGIGVYGERLKVAERLKNAEKYLKLSAKVWVVR